MMALLFIAGAFLLGSVPFAVLVSKVMKLPDPRTYGSNNPGATNVLRTGNKQAAALTLIGDAAKGAAAVLLAQHFLQGQYAAVFLVAIAVFLGHVFSLFLHFKGGKGVATALGILLSLKLMLGLVALAVWLVTAALFRYSSLAAIFAAIGACVYAALSVTIPGWYIFATFVLAGLLIWRHVGNIQNLLAGKESKIGSKKKKQQQSAESAGEPPVTGRMKITKPKEE